MKHVLAVVAAFMLMLGTASFANAGPFCPPGYEWGPAGCVPTDVGGGTSVDVNNHNTNLNTNINSNHNSNYNSNHNTNINTNKNANFNAAVQGQSVDITDNSVYEDKRDHLAGPSLLNPDAKFRDGLPFDLKMYGFDILEAKDSFTWAESRLLGRDSGDVKIYRSLLFKNDFRTDKVKQIMPNMEVVGKLMGYIHVVPNGSDVTGSGVVGKATEAAMAEGATHFKFVKASALEEGIGSAWGIGLGGGASLMARGDKTAIAPNGGLGASGANTHNELRPGLVIKLFFDENSIVAMPTADDLQLYEVRETL